MVQLLFQTLLSQLLVAIVIGKPHREDAFTGRTLAQVPANPAAEIAE